MEQPVIFNDNWRLIFAALRQRNWSLSVAESLTGGMLASAITATPGASEVFRGAVIAYTLQTKSSLLGVDAAHLAAAGPYNRETAAQMAQGVLRRCGTDLALATTGVAGPGSDGHVAAGTVFVALATAQHTSFVDLHLSGNRTEIRQQTVSAALKLLAAELGLD